VQPFTPIDRTASGTFRPLAIFSRLGKELGAALRFASFSFPGSVTRHGLGALIRLMLCESSCLQEGSE
jgi:hypothetical protein